MSCALNMTPPANRPTHMPTSRVPGDRCARMDYAAVDPRQIPDAIAIDLDVIEACRDELPRDRKIVVYCGCPNEASAAKAARLLLNRGYPWVRPLTGGLEAWSTVSEGNPQLR